MFLKLCNVDCFLSYNLQIMQLIDRGKVNVKDVALEIGLSPDSLSATLDVIPAIMCFLIPQLFSESSFSCQFVLSSFFNVTFGLSFIRMKAWHLA